MEPAHGLRPMTAVQFLNNDVLATFEEYVVKGRHDAEHSGREFRGQEGRHPYELFLQFEEIDHCRKLLDEYFRIEGRHT